MTGITESGDAAIDYSWIKKRDSVDGAILITIIEKGGMLYAKREAKYL